MFKVNGFDISFVLYLDMQKQKKWYNILSS